MRRVGTNGVVERLLRDLDRNGFDSTRERLRSREGEREKGGRREREKKGGRREREKEKESPKGTHSFSFADFTALLPVCHFIRLHFIPFYSILFYSIV